MPAHTFASGPQRQSAPHGMLILVAGLHVLIIYGLMVAPAWCGNPRCRADRSRVHSGSDAVRAGA